MTPEAEVSESMTGEEAVAHVLATLTNIMDQLTNLDPHCRYLTGFFAGQGCEPDGTPRTDPVADVLAILFPVAERIRDLKS